MDTRTAIPEGRGAAGRRIVRSSVQRSLGGRYAPWVGLLSLLVFAWAGLGWFNESVLFWFDSPIWLNRYTEYALILAFGLWRITAEKNGYTRVRLTALVAVVTVLWWWIPWQYPFVEPYAGFLGTQPVFPSLHTPGTLTFFLVLALVFLFGRRVICGWGCPCVGIRETVGFPFRHKTLRGDWAWRLRHLKWLFFAMYLLAMWAVLNPLNSWSANVLMVFGTMVIVPYFLSMMLSPITGNRAYCRYLCPYGATFGLLNRVGMFQINFNKETCIGCELCIKVCDMGIPVMHDGKRFGRVNRADCMGCGRCVTECPSRTLSFYDARNVFMPALRQNRDWLRQVTDWRHRPVRVAAGLFAFLLGTVLLGSWHVSGLVGSDWHLVSGLAGLCGFSLPALR